MSVRSSLDGAAAPLVTPSEPLAPSAGWAEDKERFNLMTALDCAISLAEKSEQAHLLDSIDRAFLDKCRRTWRAAKERGQ